MQKPLTATLRTTNAALALKLGSIFEQLRFGILAFQKVSLASLGFLVFGYLFAETAGHDSEKTGRAE